MRDTIRAIEPDSFRRRCPDPSRRRIRHLDQPPVRYFLALADQRDAAPIGIGNDLFNDVHAQSSFARRSPPPHRRHRGELSAQRQARRLRPWPGKCRSRAPKPALRGCRKCTGPRPRANHHPALAKRAAGCRTAHRPWESAAAAPWPSRAIPSATPRRPRRRETARCVRDPLLRDGTAPRPAGFRAPRRAPATPRCSCRQSPRLRATQEIHQTNRDVPPFRFQARQAGGIERIEIRPAREIDGDEDFARLSARAQMRAKRRRRAARRPSRLAKSVARDAGAHRRRAVPLPRHPARKCKPDVANASFPFRKARLATTPGRRLRWHRRRRSRFTSSVQPRQTSVIDPASAATISDCNRISRCGVSRAMASHNWAKATGRCSSTATRPIRTGPAAPPPANKRRANSAAKPSLASTGSGIAFRQSVEPADRVHQRRGSHPAQKSVPFHQQRLRTESRRRHRRG